MMERTKYMNNFTFRTNYNRKNHLDGNYYNYNYMF